MLESADSTFFAMARTVRSQHRDARASRRTTMQDEVNT
jgi:hypothetical protein